MINLKIDPEFQSQIPPLTDDEFHQLEENILKEGKLLSPLIVWNNTLVDGHNRYAILQKHPEICFSTMPLRFANREEALAWICKNQLGRRNLSPEQKRYLLGKQYESEKKAEKIFHGNQYTLAKKSGGSHDDTHHSGKKTCDRIAEENGVSRASVLRARHYTKGIDIADTLSPGIKKKVFSGEVKFTNDEMSKLVQSSPDKRQDVFAEIMHPEITKAMEAADAEPNADTPVPMPTAYPEQFKTYQVPDEFMRVYKTLSTATEMMKNTWKRVLKNNQSYLSDPEKQKVLRFAMQRPALYLNELDPLPVSIATWSEIQFSTTESSRTSAITPPAVPVVLNVPFTVTFRITECFARPARIPPFSFTVITCPGFTLSSVISAFSTAPNSPPKSQDGWYMRKLDTVFPFPLKCPSNGDTLPARISAPV